MKLFKNSNLGKEYDSYLKLKKDEIKKQKENR